MEEATTRCGRSRNGRACRLMAACFVLATFVELRADECEVVRFATFNVSMNRSNAGDLASDLSTTGNAQASAMAEILQRTRPDVVLLNEFDYDPEGAALAGFLENYLAIGQNGLEPIEYEHTFVGPSNTGVPSGFDLDNDGLSDGPGDAYGFGSFPGQFGMAVLSRFPIEQASVRTFRNFLWRDLPGALLPDDASSDEPADWYSSAELDVVRLSSKSHQDITIEIGDEIVHFLVSHPTPPGFDGPEDRNGRRNHDEIRFWSEYISAGAKDFIYDDMGLRGGLGVGELFVIAGDLNADPSDGDSIPGAVAQLLEHAMVDASLTPISRGGIERGQADGGANETHIGSPAADTADFADEGPGNLRVDYVLPSTGFKVESAGVFWPASGEGGVVSIGTSFLESSDHRLVWVDASFRGTQPDDVESIACGDVDTQSIVLLARLRSPGAVRFEVALDANFARLVFARSVETDDPLRPAKLRVAELRAGTRYYYRALAASGQGPVGTFRTLDTSDVRTNLRVGVSGKRRGDLSPHAALSNAAGRSLDVFVELGDTVWADVATPAVPSLQARTLEEFLRKHREGGRQRYGLDAIASLRASTPVFVAPDGHEVAGGFAGGASVASDPRFSPSDGAYINQTELYSTGLQAFQEAHPIEPLAWPETGDGLFDGRPDLYRYRQLSRSAALFVLDTRSFRSAPLVDVASPLDSDAIAAFRETSFDSSRELLGRLQLERLQADLLEAQEEGVVWKIVCLPAPIQLLGVTEAADRFEGYAAERNELLRSIDELGISDVVFLSAGVQGVLINNLTYQHDIGGEHVPTSAFEVTTGPIASDPPLAAAIVGAAREFGLLDEKELEEYAAADLAEKDRIVAAVIDAQLAELGYDPLGLEGSPIDATFVSGGPVAVHSYAWTELSIDAATLELRVTTWGIEAYGAEQLRADPCAIAAREPELLSELSVRPAADVPPIEDGVTLSMRGPETIVVRPDRIANIDTDVTLSQSVGRSGLRAWSYGVRAEGARIDGIDFEASGALVYLDSTDSFVHHEVTTEGAIGAVVLSLADAAVLPSGSEICVAKLRALIDPAAISAHPEAVSFEFLSGLQGSGAPVALEVVEDGVGRQPRTRGLQAEVVTLRVVQFKRGDTDGDGELDIGDAVRVFGFLFRGFPEELICARAADANDSGRVDISDGIEVLAHLFLTAMPLPPPFIDCGEDLTEDDLDCRAFQACE